MPSAASSTQYSDRATFEPAAGAVATQDLESFTPTPNAFEGVSFDFGDFAALNDPNVSFGGDIIFVSAIPVNGTTEI